MDQVTTEKSGSKSIFEKAARSLSKRIFSTTTTTTTPAGGPPDTKDDKKVMGDTNPDTNTDKNTLSAEVSAITASSIEQVIEANTSADSKHPTPENTPPASSIIPNALQEDDTLAESSLPPITQTSFPAVRTDMLGTSTTQVIEADTSADSQYSTPISGTDTPPPVLNVTPSDSQDDKMVVESPFQSIMPTQLPAETTGMATSSIEQNIDADTRTDSKPSTPRSGTTSPPPASNVTSSALQDDKIVVENPNQSITPIQVPAEITVMPASSTAQVIKEADTTSQSKQTASPTPPSRLQPPKVRLESTTFVPIPSPATANPVSSSPTESNKTKKSNVVPITTQTGSEGKTSSNPAEKSKTSSTPRTSTEKKPPVNKDDSIAALMFGYMCSNEMKAATAFLLTVGVVAVCLATMAPGFVGAATSSLLFGGTASGALGLAGLAASCFFKPNLKPRGEDPTLASSEQKPMSM